MGWIKLDDAFLDHPKFLEAGPLAGYLNIAAIAWSNRNLTDGFIPRAQIRRLVDFSGFTSGLLDGTVYTSEEETDASELAGSLCRLGLWEKVEGGWLIHGYHEWQRTSEEIIAARDDARERKRRSRSRAGSAAQHPNADESQRDTVVTHGNVTPDVTALSQAGHAPEEVRGKKEETAMSSELDDARVARELFEYWQSRCNHPNAKPTRERLAKVRARLKEGYTQQQCRQAIDGAARAAFVNDSGKRFDDFELIFRNGTKVEDFMGRTGVAATGGARPMSSLELAQQWRSGGPAA